MPPPALILCGDFDIALGLFHALFSIEVTIVEVFETGYPFPQARDVVQGKEKAFWS